MAYWLTTHVECHAGRPCVLFTFWYDPTTHGSAEPSIINELNEHNQASTKCIASATST